MKRDQGNMRRCVASEGECRVCGSISTLQAHHIVERRRTQDDSQDNLVCLCAEDHRRVHDKTLDIGPYLTADEHGCAARLCGTVHAAHKLLYPSNHKDPWAVAA